MSSKKQHRRKLRTLPHVTEAELAILKLLWVGRATTAREVRQALYPSNSASDRATVQKLFERLESKKLIERDRSGFVHSFTARMSRDEFAGAQIEALASRLTDGSLMPLITHLIGKQRLTADDRAQLRKMLNRKKG